MPTNGIPLTMQGLLWSKNIQNLDLENDKTYIVHQVLSYGDIADIRWLLEAYGKDEVAKTFQEFPKKLYQLAVFYFVKDILLELKDKALNPNEYVRVSP